MPSGVRSSRKTEIAIEIFNIILIEFILLVFGGLL